MLKQATLHGQAGRFDEMQKCCRHLLETSGEQLTTLLDIGALLLSFGFLSQAHDCFSRAKVLYPEDRRAEINLANIFREAGEHAQSRRLYSALLQQMPGNALVRRNVLVSLEYDPDISNDDRLIQAKTWGSWAIERVGGLYPRPRMMPLSGRRLRLGYISADFCQHTVGWFIKHVLETHDRTRVDVFVYSATQANDWISEHIRRFSHFSDVSGMADSNLAELIRTDAIDVLVDLSGHTAGSKLTAFAFRPAPVLVSWLGYFATTGLSCMDAVLLDQWHAPPDIETYVEPIIRLNAGRFCYQPAPFASEVAPPPFERNGYITFGSFNNTAKLNDGVFDVWSKVLIAVPDSRLVLKWRTFNDQAFRKRVFDEFVRRGIVADRIELRCPSFHADLLREYADIDIALDPFPFTGGLTSCESLWMGVPVITWPQSRVVSRQTFAFLSAIGLPELAATSADSYVQIAANLAFEQGKLYELRLTLRDRMRSSPLMDVVGFTSQLEDALIGLYYRIESEEKTKAMNAKTILHVGPGHRNSGAKLPIAFQGTEWSEIRLDIDPANEPDIVGSMLDMSAVADASVDAIHSAHNIEHVYAHEVPSVLKEFLRVLKPDGFLVITCPDLQSVCQLVVEDKLTDPAYSSSAGPITPLDILYGHGAALVKGHHYMAHKCGFTLKTLTQALHNVGFARSAGKRRLNGLDLWVVATKGTMDDAALRELAGRVLPG